MLRCDTAPYVLRAYYSPNPHHYGFVAKCNIDKTYFQTKFMGMLVLRTYDFQTKKHPQGVFFLFGGLGRNRTGIEGFAVLCITTLPPGLN